MTTPGALIAGRYRLINRVATGGMGSVWEGWDELLQRQVAVKQLLPQPGISRDDAEIARHRVIREARITARLHHPHAVTLFDVVEHAGQPCLIMQFVPSRSLNAVLQEHGVLAPSVVTRIGAEVASALAAAHRVGIVHRDVKPSNVLITPDGSAKLTDFGISHAAGDVSLTSTGMVSGTPAYLAPEVARGAASGFPADVFSLGATLYAALEGAPPFGTDMNPMAILHRVASGQVNPPRRSGPLTPLLQQMLAPGAENRPGMAEVAQALAVPIAGPTTTGLTPGPTTALPLRTVRQWPAEPPAPLVTLSESLLGSPSQAPNSPSHALGSSYALAPSDTIPPVERPAPPTGRRRRALGAVLAVALVGLVALGIALLGRSGKGNSAATPASTESSSTGPVAAGSASRSAAPSTSRSASPSTSRSAVAPTPATSRSRTTAAGQVAPARTTRSPTPTPTRSSTSAAAPTTATGSTAASTPTSSDDRTGTPTAAELATAITDYYAGLPADTDEGWKHLTPEFQATIAKNRESYQAFWDGVSTVSVTDAKGTAPGTVEATITYRFKDGRSAVEDTRYELVRSEGILKIDNSEVITSN